MNPSGAGLRAGVQDAPPWPVRIWLGMSASVEKIGCKGKAATSTIPRPRVPITHDARYLGGQGGCMNRHPTLRTLNLRRRPSRLSGWLSSKKIEEARRMTPEERRLLALELSDVCLELKRSCSAKRWSRSSDASTRRESKRCGGTSGSPGCPGHCRRSPAEPCRAKSLDQSGQSLGPREGVQGTPSFSPLDRCTNEPTTQRTAYEESAAARAWDRVGL